MIRSTFTESQALAKVRGYHDLARMDQRDGNAKRARDMRDTARAFIRNIKAQRALRRLIGTQEIAE